MPATLLPLLCWLPPVEAPTATAAASVFAVMEAWEDASTRTRRPAVRRVPVTPARTSKERVVPSLKFVPVGRPLP
ncbi:hypothetical protein CHKEEEPN_1630 [Methylorubrum podarium]|nr:hypothetical protein CHKEEEPN_1630 [Methylorubrum podarium]